MISDMNTTAWNLIRRVALEELHTIVVDADTEYILDFIPVSGRLR